MAYTKVSIPKGSGGPGAPQAKDPNVIFFLMKDVERTAGVITGFPDRDENGVKSTSDLVLEAGAEAIAVYCTPSTINRFDSSEGDADKMGWLQNFVGEHPGDELELAEFLQNNLNEDFGIITKECSDPDSLGIRLQGTPCNPMKMVVTGGDNNEGKSSTLTFASVQRGKYKSMHYKGAMPTLAADYNSGSGSGGGGA